MPAPSGITDQGTSLHLVNTVPISLSGGGKTMRKNAYCYLELYFQTKHSRLMQGHCRSLGWSGGQIRRTDGTQCADGDNAAIALSGAGFYGARAVTAAGICVANLQALWTDTEGTGGARDAFTGSARECGVQSDVQADSHQYEVSYYYHEGDIYLHFHVYPAR